MKKIRWGMLSTANINRRVIPAIRASKIGELTAVASRDYSHANSYASWWEIPHAFGSYEELLSSDLVDVVYISLPNHMHAEWSIRSLEAGKHVLCEKPFALSVSEVDQMVNASNKTNKVLTEAFMYLHHPQTRIVGEWVKQGNLGDLVLIRGIFTFSIERRNDIRLAAEFGGGSLRDVGVYPISFAQFLNGSLPEWVFGSQWTGETSVDETFIGELGYSNNSLAQISCGFRSPWYTFAEVIGTTGRLVLTRPFHMMETGRYLTYFAVNGDPLEIPVPDVELYSGEVEDIHSAILGEKPPLISLSESRNHVKTIEALYESALTNQKVLITS